MKTELLIVDVESIGLHGPAFAVAWVHMDFKGNILDEKCYAVDPDTVLIRAADRNGLIWVKSNVTVPIYNCLSVQEMRAYFWDKWMQVKDRAYFAADVVWPCEANFLSACIEDGFTNRNWDGPYPTLDIASILIANGIKGQGTLPRLPSELPEHNPLNDARQSARYLGRVIFEHPWIEKTLGE